MFPELYTYEKATPKATDLKWVSQGFGRQLLIEWLSTLAVDFLGYAETFPKATYQFYPFALEIQSRGLVVKSPDLQWWNSTILKDFHYFV